MIWVNMFKEWSNDVVCCLTLLNLFDNSVGRHIREWFSRNLFQPKDLSDAEKIISPLSKGKIEQNNFYQRCLEQYWDSDIRAKVEESMGLGDASEEESSGPDENGNEDE